MLALSYTYSLIFTDGKQCGYLTLRQFKENGLYRS